MMASATIPVHLDSGPDILSWSETVISADGTEGRASRDRAALAEGLGFAGQRLGRYRLVERLGRGCQGDVWRTVRETEGGGKTEGEGATEGEPDGEEVALKLLPPWLARDPRRLAQFRREAERRARLAVPSVLPTIELGEANGIRFMAMPLVDGCTLGQVIDWRREAMGREPTRYRERRDEARHQLACATEREYLRGVIQVIIAIARTLDHVHAARVAHRDVKPENILLDLRPDREHDVFLCDFGLSRDLDIATVEQLRDGAGTPMYMPPERLLQYEADEIRGDIYGLGATLYEAVTLALPIRLPESVPWVAWASYLATTLPDPPRVVQPDLPEALESIILRAMAHDPRQRHASAAALADDLVRFLASDALDQHFAFFEARFTASSPPESIDFISPWEPSGKLRNRALWTSLCDTVICDSADQAPIRKATIVAE